MKKILVVLAVFGLLAFGAYADSMSVTVSVTNGQAISYSAAIPVSGILEKIEISQTATTTNITIATYNGTTAVETYASVLLLSGATSKLVRPVFLPTDNTGTALAAVSSGVGTNTLTQLSIPYQKAMLGGNVKMAVTAGAADSVVTAIIYYTPVKR
jgi:hypothetical protein